VTLTGSTAIPALQDRLERNVYVSSRDTCQRQSAVFERVRATLEARYSAAGGSLESGDGSIESLLDNSLEAVDGVPRPSLGRRQQKLLKEIRQESGADLGGQRGRPLGIRSYLGLFMAR